MEGYLNSRICPTCNKNKHPGIILCLDCWERVRGATKELLLKADVHAVGRRKLFYKCIALGTQLDKIILPEDSPNLEREPVKRRRAGQNQEMFKFYDSVPVRQKRGRKR